MSSLLGGNSSSKQSSQSTTNIFNKAYDSLSSSLNPVVGQAGNASHLINQLLTGTGGDAAYKQYQDSTGFQNQLDTGVQAITNNAATSGLLNSGATLKAVNQYGQNLANQNFNNYLSQLFNLGNQGLQAGQVVSSAGGTTNTTSTSKGKSSSKQGLGL